MSFAIGTNQGGGEYYHPISIVEMPTHKHNVRHFYGNDSTGGVGWIPAQGTANSIGVRTDTEGIMNTGGTFTDRTGVIKESYLLEEVGGGHPHYNIQPYFIVYFWRRVS